MDTSPTTRRFTITRRPQLSLAACLGLAMLGITGCQDAAPAARGTPLFAADVNGGAKNCVTSKPDISGSSAASATMTVGNDGGWCGVTVAQGGRPFAAGLVQTRPSHGTLHVHSVGDATRVDYTPDAGFAGTDSFAVKLLPSNPVLSVSVTVVPK